MLSAPSAIRRESFWPARVAILAVVALQVTLNERVTVGPNWLLPGLEVLLLIPLSVVRGLHARRLHLGTAGNVVVSHATARTFAFGLIALLNVANLLSLLLLVESLLHGSKATGRLLLVDALDIWVTNIIVYALWYWELDRGGPLQRQSGAAARRDWLFTPMTLPDGGQSWHPTFVDYLFLSFTNATAFSPTDTLPLTPAAKVLMMLQAGISLLTLALVASRAVNILS
ncbi:hypothetical protein HNQ07_003864 [Deinococcus metalli]|uniref:DUF1345 domain-containing protein n=1 Tax=Deinococcus metalli TaxID=1141878 RepID=A0A7W8KII8_9DEIO|nr:hypothetical protein [Deinococcus metalli]MBB5378358.1 hypothetical protein [Deinococcus metalli]GHF59474.1 hypothetical protein GCM10017781_39730 [Deinococcus metalli]